jgi:hypothetical protein
VEASRLLYAQLSHVTLDAATIKEPSEAIYQALLRGANEVAWTTSLATPHAARLLRSGVVFVHARYARADTRRLNDRMAGRAVVAGPDDLPGLSRRAWEAERSAIQAARYLPSSLSIALAPQAASVAEL